MAYMHVQLIGLANTCCIQLWTEDNIRLACEAVKCDEYTYSRAELEFGILKSTIRDKISGKTLPGATSGPERYLTDTEEHFIKE